jgi:hypothetical protein
MSINIVQLGARMHYAVPRIYAETGLLSTFYTDSYAGKYPLEILSLIPKPMRNASVNRLLGRTAQGVSKRSIKAFNLLGLRYARERYQAADEEEALGIHIRYGKALNDAALKNGALEADAVWGFNSASLELFQSAKRSGIRTIYEQTIAPREKEREILASAEANFPSWAMPESSGSNFREFCERERQEWDLADVIVCGSQFVVDMIRSVGGPNSKCIVVPYGVDLGQFYSSAAAQTRTDDRLHVLFLGAVNLRKGVHIVSEASALSTAFSEWRVVGPIQVPQQACAELAATATVLGPRPRSEVAEHLRWADVLCLPSLCEGSATVVYEALAAGVPVICTRNSGSIVEHGVSGLIAEDISARSFSALLESLHDDRALLREMGAAAKARSVYGSFDAYKDRLVSATEFLVKSVDTKTPLLRSASSAVKHR